MTSTLKVENIKHTNNTTAQTIDSSGRILTPARPSFKAKSSSNKTIEINNDVVFDDITTSGFGLHDIGNNYNTSTGIYTAPIAGVYFFQFCVYQNASTGAEVDVYLNTQPLGVGREFGSSSLSYNTLNHCQNLLLSANDEIKVRCVVGTAYVNYHVSSFSGFLLG